MRPLLRRRDDTNTIWGDLAESQRLDTKRGLRRALSRFIFLISGIVAVIGLTVLGLFTAGLINTQPNVQDVISKAEASTFVVECGNSMGTAVAVKMPLPASYKTGVLSAAHIFDECEPKSRIRLEQNGVVVYGTLESKDPITLPADGDYGNDVALIYLKKEYPTLDPAPQAQLGDWTVVLGNPWDRVNYATFGIISAVNQDEYETDAAVNEGNSGGPLLDRSGRILGIISYKPLHENQNSSDPQANFITADGISAAKRLRVSCRNLFISNSACPFKD
jgi:S1-C subfamily serine protease